MIFESEKNLLIGRLRFHKRLYGGTVISILTNLKESIEECGKVLVDRTV